jgi:hypothetical protein
MLSTENVWTSALQIHVLTTVVISGLHWMASAFVSHNADFVEGREWRRMDMFQRELLIDYTHTRSLWRQMCFCFQSHHKYDWSRQVCFEPRWEGWRLCQRLPVLSPESPLLSSAFMEPDSSLSSLKSQSHTSGSIYIKLFSAVWTKSCRSISETLVWRSILCRLHRNCDLHLEVVSSNRKLRIINVILKGRSCNAQPKTRVVLLLSQRNCFGTRIVPATCLFDCLQQLQNSRMDFQDIWYAGVLLQLVLRNQFR